MFRKINVFHIRCAVFERLTYLLSLNVTSKIGEVILPNIYIVITVVNISNVERKKNNGYELEKRVLNANKT